MTDQNWLLQLQRGDHREDVVRSPLRGVPGGWVVRGADTAPRHGIHAKRVGQLGREVVVDVASLVAADEHDRASDASPIEHLQANARVDGDESNLMRGWVTPGGTSLPINRRCANVGHDCAEYSK